MRILVLLVMLLVSGSVWADASKVRVKAKKDSHEYEHKKYSGNH